MSSSDNARWAEWPSRTQSDLLVMAMAPSSSPIRRLSALRACRRRPSTHRPSQLVEKPTSTATSSQVSKGPIEISNGSLELAKWTALLIMTGDHINKYLFNEELPVLFEAGRIAMPLFTLVLAYNLARPNANASGAYSRMTARLALFGLISSVPFVGLENLFWGWYPLNIFFTLLVVTLVVRLVEQARSRGSILVGLGALAAFVVGGGLVEFWWPAVTIGLGAWLYFKSGNLLGLGASMTSCASLWYINGNFWALAAYPLLILLSRINVQAPRLRWFFYGYYPAHLLAIYLIRIPMARAGYEFY